MTVEDPTYALGRTAEEHRRLEQQAALFRPLTERFFRAAGIGRGMRVLDVGSGVGDVSFLAAELVGPEGEVVGLDLDGSALAKARERAKHLGLSNVTYLEGDARTAEPGRDFDAAIGRLVLLYFADPVAALAAVAERVRSGGLVAFQELDMDPEIPIDLLPERFALARDRGDHRSCIPGRGAPRSHGSEAPADLPPRGSPRSHAPGGSGRGRRPDFAGYSWLSNTLRSLAPLAEKLGIAKASELGLDSLAERLRDEAVAREMMVWTGQLVGAYARKD
jgi:SAM-dependent methyltransferase